ncbi:MAG: hypothetical protein B7Y43_14085 [Sphingomonas sp. 28-62-20]|uniref:type II toxin-antitoxin system RelE/ParE family toxin n=1 Tax=Sphingomonas sp. 28-62-20 TaxID=1970433 RepID=UPI000BD08385|nr:MAG: hypothetical protein B7Y43_14085 [Sphingomonas sp. 28-62-20]
MPRIIWTVPARGDLRNISDWLERETNPAYATRILATIRARSKFLADFPRGGRPYRDQTRILRVLGTPYLIRYRIQEGVVQVLRVHHEREDWFVEP